MQTKICPKCKEEKPISQFNKNRSRADGLSHWCAECNREQSIQYNAEHKAERQAYGKSYFANNKQAIMERTSASRKEYKQKNRDKISAYMKDYRNANRESIYETQKAYNKNHPDAIKAIKKKTYAKHRDKHLEQHKEYYQEHLTERTQYNQNYYQRFRDKIRDMVKSYQKAHPEISTKNRLRRDFHIQENGGNFSAEEWFDLCDKYDNICLCCRQSKPLTVDHIIPLSKGGTNDISNIQPLCISCNSKKKTKTIDYRW